MSKDNILGYGTGRRKSSVARVYLRKGKGKITINSKDSDVFFSRKTGLMLTEEVFQVKLVLFVMESQEHL